MMRRTRQEKDIDAEVLGRLVALLVNDVGQDRLMSGTVPSAQRKVLAATLRFALELAEDEEQQL